MPEEEPKKFYRIFVSYAFMEHKHPVDAALANSTLGVMEQMMPRVPGFGNCTLTAPAEIKDQPDINAVQELIKQQNPNYAAVAVLSFQTLCEVTDPKPAQRKPRIVIPGVN